MTGFGLISPLAANEWWRLWTCHLAHWDGRHLLLNVAAAIPPVFLMPARARLRLIGWALLSAPLVSVAILATGFHGEYRGASGIVVGLWVFVGLTLPHEGERCLGFALLAFIAVKLVLEGAGMWPAASADFVTVSAAHQAGAITGVALLFPVQALKRAFERASTFRLSLTEIRSQ